MRPPPLAFVAVAAAIGCHGAPPPPDGPPVNCTFYEAEYVYSVGPYEPSVDAASSLVGVYECASFPTGVVVTDDAGAATNCTEFATLPDPGGESDCLTLGFQVPDADTLAAYRARMPGDAALPTCIVPQLVGAQLDATGSCENSAIPGWCYVTGPATDGCGASPDMSSSAIRSSIVYIFECAEGC
jgi:hypothetical protein